MESQHLAAQRKALTPTLRVTAIGLPTLYLLLIFSARLPETLLIFGIVSMWIFLFEHSRSDRPASWENILCTTSLLALLLPMDMLWWQIILSVSFGVVIGEQVFGGRGFSFTSPVIAALAFQFYSFADLTQIPGNSVPLPVLILPLILLLFIRLIDWRALVGIVAGYMVLQITTADIALTDVFNATLLPATASIACLLFVAADPGIFKKTNASRWIYGALVGGLQYVFDPTILMLDKTVFACLLGFVAAPLIDWFVVKTLSVVKSKKSQDKRHAVH